MTVGKKKSRQISSFQIIIAGFLLVILLGTLLLMLPIAVRKGPGASFSDALFTATSAVCVTGLVVQDTATYWSSFGQAVILLLIQVGGMGVVTVAVAVAVASGRKIGLMQRSTMQEAIAAPQVGGIVRMTKFILQTSVVIELAGAMLLAVGFSKDYGLGRGIWYGIFHSVSAFCNAGFDLTGAREPFSSLTAYSDVPLINLTVMALIITGGIGFLTWEDVKKNKWRVSRYRMQTKVILSVTALLIILPALYFFCCEYMDLSLKERIWMSLFQSVTTRTAGFNTADLTLLSETGQMMMIILMLIGGSPGSTAGGMKTTTFAVLCSSAIAVFRKKEEAHFFGRRISVEAVRTAATIFVMYISLALSGAMVISYMEKIPVVSALFETSSAIGTVGLTLGVTTKLGIVSRVILILLMFLGRVGGMTLIFAAFSEKKSCSARLPMEKITVG